MAKVKVLHLQKMLLALYAKTKLSQSRKDLRTISENIDVGSEYLYKKIYNPIQKKSKNTLIGLRDDPMDKIARFLGFDNFKAFEESLASIDDEQLQSCIGNYYSYVRRNAEEGNLLRSPAKISKQKDGKILLDLKGPFVMFNGEVRKKNGCLFILLESKEGKSFYHVYKIGERKNPQVIQGTFSGVSTAFDPIGGRVVLIKTDKPFDSLENKNLSIAALEKSKLPEEKKLSKYFKEYKNNNVAPNRSSTFDLDDL